MIKYANPLKLHSMFLCSCAGTGKRAIKYANPLKLHSMFLCSCAGTGKESDKICQSFIVTQHVSV